MRGALAGLARHPWLAKAAVVLLVVGWLLAIQNSTIDASWLDSYRVVDARHLVVEAAAAPCSWTRVTRVTETATAVAVTIETWRCPRVFPGTAELRVRDVTVELSRDLGDRTVTDSFGTAIPPKPGG